MASTEPSVIALNDSHLDDLMRLSQAANWNQAPDDWRYMLGAGRGWGVASGDGAVIPPTREMLVLAATE